MLQLRNSPLKCCDLPVRTMEPDRKGGIGFRGFYGEYEVMCGDARGRVVLHKGNERKVSITLAAPAGQ